MILLIYFLAIVQPTQPTQPPQPPAGGCGIKPAGARIVGGTQAQKDSWPWQTILAGAGGGSQFCGGSLIHEQWVLTASHCVQGTSTGQIVVRLVVLLYSWSVACFDSTRTVKAEASSRKSITAFYRHHFRFFETSACLTRVVPPRRS